MSLEFLDESEHHTVTMTTALTFVLRPKPGHEAPFQSIAKAACRAREVRDAKPHVESHTGNNYIDTVVGFLRVSRDAV